MPEFTYTETFDIYSWKTKQFQTKTDTLLQMVVLLVLKLMILKFKNNE